LHSPAILLTSFHNTPAFLNSFFIVLRHILFGLFFYIPEDSNPLLFSLLLLLLYVMCVLPSSIFFFLSEFLLVSLWWFSIVLHL
jgi:hypothetical protein